MRASGGDLDAALALHHWNTAAAGAYWQVLGHLEVFLRNAIHESLAGRHARLSRPGQWFDDPAGEFDRRAHDDVAVAIRRLHRAGAPVLPGKVVAELSFWRFLLARRYTASLWPVIRPAFAHMPRSEQRLVEAPVDGCFWNACPEHSSTPQVNNAWWAAKLARNTARDADTDARLHAAGWLPVRV